MFNKIIFLDIDGVLNRWPPHPDDEDSFPRNDTFGFLAFPCKAIREVVNGGAEIVLSSSWRSHVSLDKIADNIGIPRCSIIGKTPEINSDRPLEIISWLTENDVNKFAIIDDDWWFINKNEFLKDHLVSTNIETGLIEEDLKKLKNILDIL